MKRSKAMLECGLLLLVGAWGVGCAQSDGASGHGTFGLDDDGDGAVDEDCADPAAAGDGDADADADADDDADADGDADADPVGGACNADEDCPRGARCERGVCLGPDPAEEVCGNGIDDDGDGAIDEDCDPAGGDGDADGDGDGDGGGEACGADADCPAGAVCLRGICIDDGGAQAEVCGNGVDDDGDGVIDENCNDPAGGGGGDDCADDADCAAGEICSGGACVPARR
jgi:hypothetical protein